jgi:hypothetical protein
MRQESKVILDHHRHHYTTFVNAQYMRGLNVHERNQILQVARDEFFGQNYSPDLFCGACIGEFILKVYMAYDEYILKNE